MEIKTEREKTGLMLKIKTTNQHKFTAVGKEIKMKDNFAFLGQWAAKID